jgi:UDP-N-acetylglucosamine--N-acetylmuramyl-(pentapeptide) pyrophosphoryl-undecaprenol N-acetylglucosamine transferase
LESTQSTQSTQSTKMKIIISGGGTGGHIFPAIAIADAIKVKNPSAQILFVGAEGKMEMERVPKAGYEIIGLPVAGFQRSLTLENIKRNVVFPFKLFKSLMKARQIIKDFQPDVVVGVGGYASGPILRVAMNMGISGLIQEQNSFAGVTNKLLGQTVEKVCVAYDGMNRFFAREKIVLTGNPIRRDIWDNQITQDEALDFYNLDKNKKTIVLIGGSLGARTMNQAMRDNHEIIAQNPDIQILWQCGKLYIDEYAQTQTAKLPNVKITAFLEKMDMAYAAADIVISRAGALSISEICVIGKPSILVPSPNVSEDHQTKNALALVNKSAAILVKDSDAKYNMIKTSFFLMKNEEMKHNLSQNVKLLAKPNAANDIADEVLKLIKK